MHEKYEAAVRIEHVLIGMCAILESCSQPLDHVWVSIMSSSLN